MRRFVRSYLSPKTFLLQNGLGKADKKLSFMFKGLVTSYVSHAAGNIKSENELFFNDL